MTAPHLVACVSLKGASAAPARELYVSDWFRKARAYVEAQGARWWVLSALHGLVEPGQVVEPYNLSLYDLSAAERLQWGLRVRAQLDALLPAGPVVLLAGRMYREPLQLGQRARVPMAGLGLGAQKQWLARAARLYPGQHDAR